MARPYGAYDHDPAVLPPEGKTPSTSYVRVGPRALSEHGTDERNPPSSEN